MNHLEYKKAAKRHLSTCDFILRKLDEIKPTQSHVDFLLNVYYLSGYIIECTLKYAIFKRYNHIYKDVETFDKKGVRYEENLKIHSIPRLIEELRRIDRDLPQETLVITSVTNNEIKKLINSWSVDLRYTDIQLKEKKITLDFDVLSTYFNTIKDFNVKITNRY